MAVVKISLFSKYKKLCKDQIFIKLLREKYLFKHSLMITCSFFDEFKFNLKGTLSYTLQSKNEESIDGRVSYKLIDENATKVIRNLNHGVYDWSVYCIVIGVIRRCICPAEPLNWDRVQNSLHDFVVYNIWVEETVLCFIR